jgi:hypothetical protein
MLFVVIATASGMAIYGFEGIGLGLVGLLTPVGWYIATAFNGALLVWLCPKELRTTWWRTRLSVARTAFAGPGFIAYLAMLVICGQAALPDTTDDGVRYHLAYAYEWAHAGRIFADHFRRFPYYTFNGEIIYAWMFVLRIGRYIPFLSWMTGTVAVLSVYGLIATIDEPKQRTRSYVDQGAACVVYALVPLSVIFAAVFLRWIDTAMPDAMSAMFFAAATSAIVLVICGARSTLLFGTALGTAFLAGMKPTYVVLIVIFGFFTVFAGRRAVMSRRAIVACIALMVALSLPWFARNLVADGDPLPPFLHIALGRPDPDMSRQDIEQMAGDLRSENLSLHWIETYPVRLFQDADSPEFREYGVTAVVLSLYAIGLAALLLLFSTRKTTTEVALLSLLWITIGGVLYLFATSVLARYALLVYPVVAASAGCLLLYFASAVRYGMLVAPIVAVLMMTPSASAQSFYDSFSSLASLDVLAKIMPDDQSALELELPGYQEAEPLFVQRPWEHSDDPNVLLVNTDIQYYVELYGGEPFGDWFGQARYSALIEAVDEQRVVPYLNDHHISAILVRRKGGALVEPELSSLHEQVVRGGFVELDSSDANYDVFVGRRLVEKSAH